MAEDSTSFDNDDRARYLRLTCNQFSISSMSHSGSRLSSLCNWQNTQLPSNDEELDGISKLTDTD